MDSNEIRSRFLKFFEKRGHKIIPSASLVPENDPSSLFISAGMQPLIPYLLGESHPLGKRLVNIQKCVRTGDIEEVGDNRHLTFFEMLGNWSLGDYFKKEAINWSYEFIVSKEEGLGLDKKRLYVTVFKGVNDIPRDEESIFIWKDIFEKEGISSGVAGDDEVVKEDMRIIPLGIDDNFWIAGKIGPCGGDTEMFYDTKPELGLPIGKFSDLVNSFRFVEIWNDVFIEFNKMSDGKTEPLKQKSVDTGMGLERTMAVTKGKDNVFDIELLEPFIKIINENTNSQDEVAKRIIADHLRAAVFILSEDIEPSNTSRGYVLRRLLRRTIYYLKSIQLSPNIISNLVDAILNIYSKTNYELNKKENKIKSAISKELQQFLLTLQSGKKHLEKIIKQNNTITGHDAFMLFSTDGYPLDLTLELIKENKILTDENLLRKEFEADFSIHQNLSRTASAGMFKGGLANTNEKTIKLHTAHHLLLAGLQAIVSPNIKQKGSNINEERLRMDFLCDHKLTDEEKQKVEDWVNDKIKKGLEVVRREMPLVEAEKIGAQMEFGAKYPDIVSVYFIENKDGDIISKEFCGGPHVKNVKELGILKIQKEEAVAQGIRRIKAVLL